MSRFRHPSEHEINSSQQEIIASLEISGLDRMTTLVLGGSALALAGIRPARDVDVMVPGETFRQFVESGQTPGGTLIRPKPGALRPFLETRPSHSRTNTLSLDITHPHDDRHHLASPELDRAFLSRIAELPHVDGFRYLPPELVAARKSDSGRRKDRHDRRLIGQHLK